MLLGRIAPVAVEQDPTHADRAGALDVVGEAVADHGRAFGRCVEQVDEPRRTGLALACRLQLDAKPPPRPPIALRSKQWPRLGDREVDVEEDRAEPAHTSAGQRYAAGWRLASDGTLVRTRSRYVRS